MARSLECEVLVAGLGPVGAALASLLTDLGVRVIAIDKSTEVYPLPRAVHFDDEIMRVFQRLGVAQEVLRHARPAPAYEFRNASGEILVSFKADPDRFAPSGWARGYMFNQPGLERALRAKLEVSPLAEVRLGACLAGVSVTAEGIEARVVEAEDPLVIKARFLVGCDGASSGVRETIGGGLEDLEFDEPWLVVDVVPGPGSILPEVNLQICDPDRPITCVQSGPGRHRWEIMLRPEEAHDEVLNDGFIRAELAKFGVDVEIERKAVYRFHGLIARRWRRGPVLIAGDAAHQTPPFAGQGLCAGVRDAANLAWKLNRVLRGEGAETLLDTYQTEREPNVRAYIQHAIDMGRVVCTTDPEAARRRDEHMLAARRAGLPAILPAAPPPLSGPCVLDGAPGAGEVFPQPVSVEGGAAIRLDDRLGLHGWLIGTPPRTPCPPGVDWVSLQDPRIAPFRAELAAWLERREAPAVLVRPDRYVFGSGDPDRLARAWSSAVGSPPSMALA